MFYAIFPESKGSAVVLCRFLGRGGSGEGLLVRGLILRACPLVWVPRYIPFWGGGGGLCCHGIWSNELGDASHFWGCLRHGHDREGGGFFLNPKGLVGEGGW